MSIAIKIEERLTKSKYVFINKSNRQVGLTTALKKIINKFEHVLILSEKRHILVSEFREGITSRLTVSNYETIGDKIRGYKYDLIIATNIPSNNYIQDQLNYYVKYIQPLCKAIIISENHLKINRNNLIEL